MISGDAAAACGGDGQKACTVSRATLAGKLPTQRCPSGAFFDPIDGGSCWRCPAGAKRTVLHVKSGEACEQPAREKPSHAKRHGRGTGLLGTDCPRGQFLDPNGYCWSCPAGHARTANPVTAGNACSASVAAVLTSAKFEAGLACPHGFYDPVDGGTCWTCPKGYLRTAAHVRADNACAASLAAGVDPLFGTCEKSNTNIRGTCNRIGSCGARGQRPCLLGERSPSCDANLKENFNSNVCEALKPGETPFLAGMASATEFYGAALGAACRSALGGVKIPSDTQLASGANCSKNVVAGAACVWVVDQAGGGAADTAHALLAAGPMAVQFKLQVDQAYASPACKGFAETTAHTKRFARGSGVLGTDCAAGQFVDPNGWCYSCPKGYTRTLHPVDAPNACVDKFGAELVRSSCSVFVAVSRAIGKSAQCAVAVMQSNAFLSRPLDFSAASQEFCMSTGEFAYSVYDLIATVRSTPQQKSEKLDTALRRLLAAIKREATQARRFGDVVVKTASAADQGTTAVGQFNNLPSCKQ